MGEVVNIPGLLTTLPLDPEKILTAAIGEDLEEVGYIP